MDISTAIETRKSIRTYLDKPVPKDIVRQILEKAIRSPSGTNIQPWHIYVVTGEVLEQIKRENVQLFLSGVKPTLEEIELPGIFKQRRKELAIDLFQLLEIKREDREKRDAWTAKGEGCFDAPTVLIFTIDKALAGDMWSLLGIGALLQTVCLAAMEYGLGTCISAQGVSYHDVIRKYMEVPEDESILISVMLGYPDPDAPANRLVSKRAPLDEVTSWF